MKDMIHQLINNGSLDYGSVLEQSKLQALFGIKPMTAADMANMSLSEVRHRISKETLDELGVSDTIRTELRKLGRHFQKNGSQYRVCTPSENIRIIEDYMSQSQRKLSKARLLLKNSPNDVIDMNNNLTAKLLITDKFIKKAKLG